MNAELLLGIDLGTSSVKAVFMDALGNVMGTGQREYPIDSPQIGRAEQPPEEWWKAVVLSVREGFDEARGKAGGEITVKAVGFSGQMHGLVALRHDDSPAMPAIIWADQRSTDEARDVNEAIEKIAIEKTCNKASPGFLLPSLLWLMRREPEIFAQIRTVMLPKDYIRFRMTGHRASEPTDAAGTCAYNVRDGGWNTGLLEALSLPSRIFPEIVPTGAIAGQITPGAAEELGLPAGTPVAAGAADQPAGALSGGQKKLLELCRALAREPKVVLLDEPAAGVHPSLLEELAGYLKSLRGEGQTFVVVEHNMDMVAALCERVYVMVEGSVVAEGSLEAVASDNMVRDAYFGEGLGI